MKRPTYAEYCFRSSACESVTLGYSDERPPICSPNSLPAMVLAFQAYQILSSRTYCRTHEEKQRLPGYLGMSGGIS